MFGIEPQHIVAFAAAISVFCAILALAMPLLHQDKLSTRMKHVAIERERIRARERAKLAEKEKKSTLRTEPKKVFKDLVERFNMTASTEDGKLLWKLKQAGFRDKNAAYTFLALKIVLPVVFFFSAAFYIFVIVKPDQTPLVRLMMAGGAGLLGLYAPSIYLNNAISKRQLAIKRAWPDALDLLLICVESGMSIEAAFRKVADEIGRQSVELAEELSLTTAELAYLQERRQAYENLAKRTGLEGVKSVVTSLVQAEKYGTPVGQSLRVLAQENRDMRMSEAEKKAAALPPKLTVPMIIFFLPVLFAVIIAPAFIKLSGTAF